MSGNRQQLREIIVQADIQSLNAECERNNIDVERIVSIIHLPGTNVAHGGGDRLRIFYKAREI